MGEERDPIAAMNNAAGKDGETDAENANFTDAFDAPDRQGVMGPDNGPQHRAGPGEGVRAPFASETGGSPEFSVFDGKGNESVVVMTETEDGRPAQGTGDNADSAQNEAGSGATDPGSSFGNPQKD